jgi:hypothetical protein
MATHPLLVLILLSLVLLIVAFGDTSDWRWGLVIMALWGVGLSRALNGLLNRLDRVERALVNYEASPQERR